MKKKYKPKWKKQEKEDYSNFSKRNFIKAVPKEEVRDDVAIIGSIQGMKKMHVGTHRARLNARGCEQIDGKHYDSKNISSLEVNEAPFRVVLAIVLTF